MGFLNTVRRENQKILVTAPQIPPTTFPTPLTAAAGTAIIVSIQPLTSNAKTATNKNLNFIFQTP